MSLPTLVYEKKRLQASGGISCPEWNRERQTHATILVHLKAEQFIIKNKNIKQERGKQFIGFTNFFFFFPAIQSLRRFQHKENDLLSLEILPFNLVPLVTVFHLFTLPYRVNIEHSAETRDHNISD